MSTEPQLAADGGAMPELVWRPDKDGGFHCYDGETAIGRIMQIGKGHPGAGHWRWFAGFVVKPNVGITETREEAMADLEDIFRRYFALWPKARTMYPYPPVR